MLINVKIQLSSEEDLFPECPKYEGSINERGNVKNAIRAFDLLLNQEDDYKDSIVSSSFLKEKNKPADYYAPWKANDTNNKTAWAEGKKGDGVGEKLYLMPVGKFKTKKINFSITNGYAETEKLYLANNRVKKAKLTIYEARFDICGGYYSARRSDLLINTSKIIELKDTMEPQKIIIEVDDKKTQTDDKEMSKLVLFMAELEILEVYKGTKYDDTCISEFNILDN